MFYFKSFLEAAKIEPVTKRVVLSLSAKQCDPLGLLSPIVLCKSNADWDTPLDDKCKEQWIRVVTDIKRVNLSSLDRHYF